VVGGGGGEGDRVWSAWLASRSTEHRRWGVRQYLLAAAAFVPLVVVILVIALR